MRRGDVVTVAAEGYAGKPRPAVVLQSDAFSETASVTLCLMTTTDTGSPLFRLRVEPGEALPLREASFIMADKVMTVRRAKVGPVIGRLPRETQVALDRALVVFLGIG